MEPCVELRSEPSAVGRLIAAAIAGDLLAPVELPVSWGDDGLPRVDGLTYQEERGADRWLAPATALRVRRVDCAVLVRVYAQIWGSHVGVSPLASGKMHAVLFEDWQLFDPSRVHGAKVELPASAFKLTPLERPATKDEELIATLGRRLGFEFPGVVAGRLALASGSADPARLKAVALRFLTAPQVQIASDTLRTVVELVDAPQDLPTLLAGPGRLPAALAAIFVARVRPGALAAAVTPRPALEPVPRPATPEVGAALEELRPGCPGGCSIVW